MPATRQVPSSQTSSTSRAVTSRAVSTLIRLRSSTSARSSTSPGRRSNCARLSFVVEVRAAAGSSRSIRSIGTNNSRPPIRAVSADHRRQRVGEVEPRDDILDAPEPLARGVEQRAARQRGQMNDGVGHQSLGAEG